MAKYEVTTAWSLTFNIELDEHQDYDKKMAAIYSKAEREFRKHYTYQLASTIEKPVIEIIEKMEEDEGDE